MVTYRVVFTFQNGVQSKLSVVASSYKDAIRTIVETLGESIKVNAVYRPMKMDSLGSESTDLNNQSNNQSNRKTDQQTNRKDWELMYSN